MEPYLDLSKSVSRKISAVKESPGKSEASAEVPRSGLSAAAMLCGILEAGQSIRVSQ